MAKLTFETTNNEAEYEALVAGLSVAEALGTTEIKIATRIPRKTLPQIKQHFEALLKDIQMIESGLVPVPDYDGDTDNTTTSDNISAPTIDNKFQHAKRKKGKPWSEREHEYV
ncbi:hypothetical protein F2P56_023498 [Juglans regia]|uniref:Uncharacterized protein n=1 Tax=Juglans regia TaxID=51240 RepID=A0A833UL36_JUGRE|nr:hypothetical protein F2P56_023498 [Juglans regia]